MPARFQAIDSFHLPERKLFCIGGTVLEGTVKSGMLLSIPFSSFFEMTEPIHSVERATTSEGTRIVLTFRLKDEDHAVVLMGLNLGAGEVLDVIEAAANP